MNVRLTLLACSLALHAPGQEPALQIDLATLEWRLKTGDDAGCSSLGCDDRGWLRVRVPGGWESVVPGYDGIGWYRVRFVIPEAWRGQKLVCFPGKIDDRAEVFFNGRSLGEGGGYQQPPSARLPRELVRYGEENVLALRVQDYGQRGGLFAGPILVKPEQLADRLDVQALLRPARDETPAALPLTVTNRSPDAFEGKLSYEVSDYYGEAVKRESSNLRLGARQDLSRHITLPTPGCEEYRATVTVADGKGETIQLWRAGRTGKLDGIRKEVVLSGEWNICFADSDDAPPADAKWEKIRVPWFWTKGRAKDALVAWYRRKVSVPKTFAGQQLALRFQAVLFACRVFVNGRYAGEHFGGYSPFEVEVTDLMRPGAENEITVRVQDWTAAVKPGFLPRESPWDREKDRPLMAVVGHISAGRPGGIWQDVFLQARPAVHVADVQVITSVQKREIRLVLDISNESEVRQETSIHNAVHLRGQQVLSLTPKPVRMPPGRARVELAQQWRDPQLWSPDSPTLYKLVTTLRDGQGRIADRLATRFGFREFWVDGNAFRLNGAKVRLFSCSAIHTWGHFESREDLRARMRRMMASHMNYTRFHVNPPPYYYHDLADELGLLVCAESPLRDERQCDLAHPRYWQSAREEVVGMVKRDRNHPSVVMWSVENEYLSIATQQAKTDPAVVEQLWRLHETIRELDPTRPMEFESDGDLGGRVAVACLHYPLQFPRHILLPNEAYRLGQAPNDCWPHDFRWRGEKPLLVGEMCFVWHNRPPSGVSFVAGEKAYVSPHDSAQAQVAATSMIVEAYRNLEVAGIVPWIGGTAGEQIAREHYRPLRVSVQEYDGRFFAGETVTRQVNVYHNGLHVVEATLRWDAVCGSQPVAKASRRIRLQPGDTEKISARWTNPGVSRRAPLTFRVSLRTGGQVAHEVEKAYAVFPRAVLSQQPVETCAIFDPVGATAKCLGAIGLQPRRVGKLTGDELREVKLLLIGKGSAAHLGEGRVQPVREFAAAGGIVFFFEQERLPPRMLPVSTAPDRGHTSTISFVRSGQHPLAKGLEPDDLRFWRGDNIVSRSTLSKPLRGGFRVVADNGGRDGLEWTSLMEIPYGAGAFVLCQLVLTEKLAAEPAARAVLRNVIDYATTREPTAPMPVALIAPNESPLRKALSDLEVEATTLGHLSQSRVLIIDGRKLDTAQLPANDIRRFVAKGGAAVLHALEPGSLELANKLLPVPIDLTPIPKPARTRAVRTTDDPALTGVSNHELFWHTDGMWEVVELGRHYGKPIRDIARFAVAPREAGRVKVLAEPPVLVRIDHGRGFFLIDQILWDEGLEKPALASRIGCLLLTNLGARFQVATPTKVAEADCLFIDVASKANASLRDDRANDGAGGWTDQGENDLRELPLGQQTFTGVPFLVRDACVVLHSPKYARTRPRRVSGIPVGRQLRELHFLHAAAWGGASGTTIARYVVHYADGRQQAVPVVYGAALIDWWHDHPRDLAGATLAWAGKNPVHSPVSTYRMQWTNPRPEVSIESIDVTSVSAGTIPILIAVTGVRLR